MTDVTFCSSIDDVHQNALEQLMFFNARQQSVRAGVIEALERYGPPMIEHHEDALRVTIAGSPDAQCLFALGEAGGRPELLGAVIYVRSSLDTLTILHLAVADDTVTEDDQNPLIVVRIVHQLRELARYIRGVKWVHVLYPQGGQFRIPIHPSSPRREERAG